MVCPCLAVPALAATGIGGALIAQKQKQNRRYSMVWLLWLFLVLVVIAVWSTIVLVRQQRNKKKNSCSVCKLTKI